MANAQHTQIADAVVTSLNAASFDLTFAATRKKLPKHTLVELATLRVTVSPRARQENWKSRTTRQVDYQIGIGVQRTVGSETNGDPKESEIDVLETLAEDIVDHLASAGAMAGVELVGIEDQPLLSESQLENDHLVTIPKLLTYRAYRTY